MTGYKTYLSIILTAVVVLCQYFGVISADTAAAIVSVLSAFGLWSNSQRVNVKTIEPLQKSK